MPCRGNGCNELFPPPYTMIQTDQILPLITYYDHETVCNEPVDSWWNPWATCGETYFPCEEPCGHGSSSGSGSGTPSPPSYHACGVHETSVSGSHGPASCGKSGHYVCDSKDHSYVSCPKDSNNQACEYGSYYACSPHEHAYPAVDNTPNCSSCTNGCSICQATCANGHIYDPRNSDEVNEHRTRTCKHTECRQTWERCGTGAPICNKPYRKKNRMSCQALN